MSRAVPTTSPPNATDLRISPREAGVDVELPSAELRFFHSFLSGPVARRAGQPAQLLLKACNNKQRSLHGVLDLTAGWGVDAFVLARHGQRVTLLEQDRRIHDVVAHSLQCLRLDPRLSATAAAMTLHHAEALAYLRDLPGDHEFDCIYLDPMFPAHKSGAKPAKEMQVLQALADNCHIEACLELACRLARKRVVVKRAARAAPIGETPPDLVQRARTIRFDIYLTR